MKPRLEPLEHTAADALMWADVNWRGGPRFGPTLWTRSLMQDRRDAELMSKVECMRLLTPKGYQCAVVHAIMRGAELETGRVAFP